MGGTNQLTNALTVEENSNAINVLANVSARTLAATLFTTLGNPDTGSAFSSYGHIMDDRAVYESLYVAPKNSQENALKGTWLEALRLVAKEASDSVKKYAAPDAVSKQVTLWKNLAADRNLGPELTVTSYELDLGVAAVVDDNGVETAPAVEATFQIKFSDASGQLSLNTNDFTKAELQNFLQGELSDGNALTRDSKAYKGIMESAKVSSNSTDFTLKQMAALFSSETLVAGMRVDDVELDANNYLTRPKLAFAAGVDYRFEILKQGERYRIIAVPTNAIGVGKNYGRKTVIYEADTNNPVTVVTSEFLVGGNVDEVPPYYTVEEIRLAYNDDKTDAMFTYQSTDAKKELNLSFLQNLEDLLGVSPNDEGKYTPSLAIFKQAYVNTKDEKRGLTTILTLADKFNFETANGWTSGVVGVSSPADKLKAAIGQAGKHDGEIAALTRDGTNDLNFEEIFKYTAHIVSSATRKGLLSPVWVERLIRTADYQSGTNGPDPAKMSTFAAYILESVTDVDAITGVETISTPNENKFDLLNDSPSDKDITISTPSADGGVAVFRSGGLIYNIHAISNIFSSGTTISTGANIYFKDVAWGVTHNNRVKYNASSADGALNKSLISLRTMLKNETNGKFSSAKLYEALRTVITETAATATATAVSKRDIALKIARVSGENSDVLDNINTSSGEVKPRTVLRRYITNALASVPGAVEIASTIDNIFHNDNDKDLVQAWVKEFKSRDKITTGSKLLSEYKMYYSPLVYGKRDDVDEMIANVSANSSPYATGQVPDVTKIGSIGSATDGSATDADFLALLGDEDLSAKVNYLFTWKKGHVAPADASANAANLDTIMAIAGFSTKLFVGMPQSGVIELTLTTSVNGQPVYTYSDNNGKKYLSTTLVNHPKFLDGAVDEASKVRAIYLKVKEMPASIESMTTDQAQNIITEADAINEHRLSSIIGQNVGDNDNLEDAYDDLIDFALVCGELKHTDLEARIISNVLYKLNGLDASKLEVNGKTKEEIKIDAIERYISGSVSFGSDGTEQFTTSDDTFSITKRLPSDIGNWGAGTSPSAGQMVYTNSSRSLSVLFDDLNIESIAAFKHGRNPGKGVIRHVALMAMTKDNEYEGTKEQLTKIVEEDPAFLDEALNYFITFLADGSARDVSGGFDSKLFFDRKVINELKSEYGAGVGNKTSFLLENDEKWF